MMMVVFAMMEVLLDHRLVVLVDKEAEMVRQIVEVVMAKMVLLVVAVQLLVELEKTTNVIFQVVVMIVMVVVQDEKWMVVMELMGGME